MACRPDRAIGEDDRVGRDTRDRQLGAVEARARGIDDESDGTGPVGVTTPIVLARGTWGLVWASWAAVKLAVEHRMADSNAIWVKRVLYAW